MPPKISARLQSKVLAFRTEYRAVAPPDATPEGIKRALYLCGLKKQRRGSKTHPDAKDPSLQSLLDVEKDSPLYELYKQRRDPSKDNRPLRNKAFLITLVLQGEGHLTSTPPTWQLPQDTLPHAGVKRISPEGPGTPDVEHGFDLKDKNR